MNSGSGKTTLISLICSDHPQTYSLPVEIFGRTRLPQRGKPGISVFDVQAKIGQSSPEVHAFFPQTLSMRKTLENAWAETFLGTPFLDDKRRRTVDACLRWFEPELNPSFNSSVADQGQNSNSTDRYEMLRPRNTQWADLVCFGDTPFSTQRVALFLRAIIKKPPLIVLDEAFSGMDEYVRDKCMLFLTWGESKSLIFDEDANGHKSHFTVEGDASQLNGNDRNQHEMKGLDDEQALICISHVMEECPAILREWICLPEPESGKPARFGRFSEPLNQKLWSDIWSV